jgi:hypothetical protein
MNLIKNIKIRKVAVGAAAGTTVVNSSGIDMQNFDGVMFFTTIATADAGNFIKVQQDAASNFSTAQDLAETKVVAAGNGSVVYVDVYRPAKRYLRAVITRGVSTATGDLYAIQYNGRAKPDTNLVTNELIGKLHISPEEGTA